MLTLSIWYKSLSVTTTHGLYCVLAKKLQPFVSPSILPWKNFVEFATKDQKSFPHTTIPNELFKKLSLVQLAIWRPINGNLLPTIPTYSQPSSLEAIHWHYINWCHLYHTTVVKNASYSLLATRRVISINDLKPEKRPNAQRLFIGFRKIIEFTQSAIRIFAEQNPVEWIWYT